MKMLVCVVVLDERVGTIGGKIILEEIKENDGAIHRTGNFWGG